MNLASRVLLRKFLQQHEMRIWGIFTHPFTAMKNLMEERVLRML
jgi:hypothetical protein